MAKEMLPILDKPVVQYVVEEAVSAGITEIFLVVGEHYPMVRRHFDRHPSLEDKLQKAGHQELIDKLTAISSLAKFTYVKDEGPYGNAMPVLNAARHISDEPFLLFWADDFFISEVPRAQQLVEKYQQYGQPVISLVPMGPKEITKYGVPSIAEKLDDRTFRLNGLIEKPDPKKAPSSFASVGGYLLTPEIIPLIAKLAEYRVKHGGEVYLAEAMNQLAQQDTLLGTVIEGRWHDTGTREGYFKAVVDVGLTDPALRKVAKSLIDSKDHNKFK